NALATLADKRASNRNRSLCADGAKAFIAQKDARGSDRYAVRARRTHLANWLHSTAKQVLIVLVVERCLRWDRAHIALSIFSYLLMITALPRARRRQQTNCPSSASRPSSFCKHRSGTRLRS